MSGNPIRWWSIAGLAVSIAALTASVAVESLKRLLLIFAVIVGCCGCVVPLPPIPYNTGGHQYRPEDVTFLDKPGTIRATVIDYLGTPDWVIHDPGVIAYVWEMTKTYGAWAIGAYGVGAGGSWDKKQRWALFIAFDEHDQVSQHGICILADNETVEGNAVSWFNRNR